MSHKFIVEESEVSYFGIPYAGKRFFDQAQKIYDREKQNNLMKCELPSSKKPRTYTL